MSLAEASLERKFRRGVAKLGGKAIKLTGLKHIPDRLVLWNNGTVHFVEMKAPGKTPRPGQVAMHKWLRMMGFKVSVISTKEELTKWLTIMAPSMASKR